MDKKSFYMGNSFDAYEYMGAHVVYGGVVFRTFAPEAVGVSLIGEFSGWNEIAMDRMDSNFFECFVPEAKEGQMYKYRIYQRDGRAIDHCDPYGFGMELRPNNASIIRNLSAHRFNDEKWMQSRSDGKTGPMNIYEVHLGSWKKKTDDDEGWYTYSEIADMLIEYVKEAGYNYIELMPLGEYPCDESWGYQSVGFFSPTSRYGTAEELMEFTDKCHQNGIGVIIDFVPVHFAVDDYGLANYDGTALYEYPNQDIGNSEWGSRNFMHSRGEVRSFLKSAANYWLKEYHFDGIRMDAIRNMIYWNGDEARGVNMNAVNFLQSMNEGLKAMHKGVILCAEDSTNFKGITRPAAEGGIGFDYKWDMGFMNDTLSYFQADTEGRRQKYHKLTFSMMYFYDEKYILPFSHDEVVHGKATILQKMNGDYEKKFPQARAMYMYMYVHPGKKLNFMANEIGQLREWDEKRQQDWDILKYPKHDSFRRFIFDINKLYLGEPALWDDYGPEGFRWTDCHEEDKCVYAMERRGGGKVLLGVFNFSDMEQKDFELKNVSAKKLELIMSTEDEKYGGSIKYKKKVYDAAEKLNIPPFCGMIFEEKF